ncbi:hypothetical protein [Enterobacter hormaechei]|uniref:hypothetical protein n=1 Tax=Enterobacter hormaechei TaxID=158836 RepID=UPI0028754156|nr:hypothetical protein [Enterobacter hormaechei]MDS0007172.1 hypothetical protein [Enterobacter hormaechei subsp. xiangfangensis]
MSLSNRVKRLQQQVRQPEGAAVVMIISDIMDELGGVTTHRTYTPAQCRKFDNWMEQFTSEQTH